MSALDDEAWEAQLAPIRRGALAAKAEVDRQSVRWGCALPFGRVHIPTTEELAARAARGEPGVVYDFSAVVECSGDTPRRWRLWAGNGES